jgi:hypothetical protein
MNPQAQGLPLDFEGFGAVTRGHLDCPSTPATYRVTNLNDSGAGSFRTGVSAGCRLIVFDVAGTIPVNSNISINQDYLTIDGSTAPAPGITLQTASSAQWIVIIGNGSSGSDGVHDVIMRHIRQVGPGGHSDSNNDLCSIDGGANGAARIVYDHMTCASANDGAGDIWGTVSDVTYSWNLYRDTRTAAVFSSDHLRRNISVHHNVFANNNERQIKTNQRNEMIEYINNVVYGWGWHVPTGSALDLDAQGYTSTHPMINVINNRFHFVSGLNGGANQAIVRHGTGRVFFAGNIVPAGESDVTSSSSAQHVIPSIARVTTYAAASLGDTVVPCVGMMHPTSAERQLLQTISAAIGGTGGQCASGSGGEGPLPPTNVRIVK